MKIKRFIYSVGCFVVLMFLANCQNQKYKKSEDPFEYYQPDPDIYGKTPDPAFITTDASGVHYAVNQAIVTMEEGSPFEEAQRIAHEMGGEIVGQIPPLDLYQMELPVDSTEKLEETMQAVLENSTVEGVSPNIAVEFEDTSECPPPNDNNDNIEGMQRCFYSDIDYYPFLTVFESIRPYLELHDVNVAVIDTGLDMSSGEFNQTPILNLLDKNASLTDYYLDRDRKRLPHGTWVAGIIAADNNGNKTNGLASRFLEDHLFLLVGGGKWGGVTEIVEDPHRWLFMVIIDTMYAAAGHANVVNLSLGVPVPIFCFYAGPYIRAKWERVFYNSPDILFVVSSPSRKKLKEDLTMLNRPPGGSPSPNVITVGGTTKCEPNRIAEEASGRGPLIEIVAPAEMVPVVKVGDASDFRKDGGSSYAAPQVTSLAAIMKSIDYTLSPEKIKEYITTNAFPALDDKGRLYARLNYYLPVAQLLMDTNPKPEILDIIASYDAPSKYVNVGEAALRKCSGLYYTVEDYGTHYYAGEEGEINEEIIGQIAESGWSLFATSDDAYLNSSCFDCNFEMERGFPVNQEAQSTPETVGVSFTYMLSQDFSPSGTGIEGEFRFLSCRIIDRHYLTQSPWYVAMEGKFEGILEILDDKYQPEPLIEREFSGNYNVLFINIEAGQQSSINEYLENICDKEG